MKTFNVTRKENLLSESEFTKRNGNFHPFTIETGPKKCVVARDLCYN